MNKKGAINLSINMIIVLILAIIILGFALSFITSTFRDAETSLRGQFPEPKVTVTRDNPIGTGQEFLIQPGEIRKMSLRIFNTGASEITSSDVNTGSLNCAGLEIDQVEPGVTIESGETKSLKVVFRGTPSLQNNAICTMTLNGDVKQSFFINTE